MLLFWSLYMSKILIVDDTQDIVVAMQQFLSRSGHEVFTACDGLEGLEQFKLHTPAVVVTDIGMPRCDGNGLIDKIRALPQGAFVPIIVLSARILPEDQKESYLRGADGYVCKPITRDQRSTFLAMIESLALRYSARQEQLRLSTKDGLTNLSRRESFVESLEDNLNTQDKTTIAILDIDHFKRVNDTYGHPTGDAILRQFATIVSNNLRNGETAYRYGGEEFTILFTKVSDSQAVQAIERVRKIISKEIFEQNIAITFSAGVYESQPGEDQKSCIAKADEGLYEAKRTGRNKTIVYDKTSLKKEAS